MHICGRKKRKLSLPKQKKKKESLSLGGISLREEVIPRERGQRGTENFSSWRKNVNGSDYSGGGKKEKAPRKVDISSDARKNDCWRREEFSDR